MEEHETLVDAICKKAEDTLSLANAEFRILEKFIALTKEISTPLGNQAAFPPLITFENSSLATERLTVVPIYSKLFLRAVDTCNIPSNSVCAALSDAYHVSRHVIEIGRIKHPRRSPLPIPLVPLNIVLPKWLKGNKEGRDRRQSDELRHIQIREEALCCVEELTSPQLLSI